MARDRLYNEWQFRQILPAEIDAATARDILLDCFYTAHGAHFEATKTQLGISAEGERVLKSAKGVIRLAFKHVGGNYDTPTKAQLEKVAAYLADKSRSWGTPELVVQRHQAEMQRVLSRVRED